MSVRIVGGPALSVRLMPPKKAGAAYDASTRHVAPKGNLRKLVHGANTPQLVAPRRQAHLDKLRDDYPHLDERRLALMADRLARIDLATAWLEKQKSLVANKQGDIYPVAREVEKWAARAEHVLAEAEKEGRKARRIDLATEMSELEEGEAA